MQRSLLLLLLCLLLSVQCFSQDKAVPDYVVKQDFPDSVQTIALTKLDGIGVTFSEMLEVNRGKKVVIDIWASWCRDCFVGLPKLEELKKKTVSQNVAFVFISIDEDDTKWRNAISRFGVQGQHYRIKAGWKNPLSNYIVLDWVPRYMTLNENGRVVMPKAIVSSDKGLVKSIMR